jgi:hypothetical protein
MQMWEHDTIKGYSPRLSFECITEASSTTSINRTCSYWQLICQHRQVIHQQFHGLCRMHLLLQRQQFNGHQPHLLFHRQLIRQHRQVIHQQSHGLGQMHLLLQRQQFNGLLPQDQQFNVLHCQICFEVALGALMMSKNGLLCCGLRFQILVHCTNEHGRTALL